MLSSVSFIGSAPSYFASVAFSSGRFAAIGVNRNRRNENVTIDVALQNLRGVAHPDGQRRRVIDHNVPFAFLSRHRAAHCVADQLLDFLRQFAGMRFTTIENGNLMAAAQGIFYLDRSSKAGAAEDENPQRFHRVCRKHILNAHRGSTAAEILTNCRRLMLILVRLMSFQTTCHAVAQAKAEVEESLTLRLRGCSRGRRRLQRIGVSQKASTMFCDAT